MNVGKNTTLCDCDVSEESSISAGYGWTILVQFFVVPNGELKMTRDDTS